MLEYLNSQHIPTIKISGHEESRIHCTVRNILHDFLLRWSVFGKFSSNVDLWMFFSVGRGRLLSYVMYRKLSPASDHCTFPLIGSGHCNVPFTCK